jgi:hypothetical protein
MIIWVAEKKGVEFGLDMEGRMLSKYVAVRKASAQNFGGIEE